VNILRFPDLSHYEPDVQFHAMIAGGVPAFITKATQGSSNTDPTYAHFSARGRSVGLIAGAYSYLAPGDPVPQIDHFLSVAGLQAGDLPPIIDAEATGLSKGQTFAALQQFESRGFRPILYCSLSFFKDVLGAPTDWPLWLAAYRPYLPPLPEGVTLFAWQHTDHGVCPGVAQPCDMNYFYGDLSALKRFCL